MPEDAGVNGLAPHARVREMQTKLHRWAVADPGRRFDDLYNLVCDPAFLQVAWERVAGNSGARTAGVDRYTVRGVIEQVGVTAFLENLRDQLRQRTYRPLPVRERMIPKYGGKLRKLGIPTVGDRVVQAALKLVLEPIFEADFASVSYGFRPRRRAHDAIAEIHFYGTWAIARCWTRISRRALTRSIACGPDGPGAAAGHGQACARPGQGVLEGRCHDRDRCPAELRNRHPARRDPVPTAGQHRPDGARRAPDGALEAGRGDVDADAPPYSACARTSRTGGWSAMRMTSSCSCAANPATSRRCARRSPPCSPRWVCACPRTRPAWWTCGEGFDFLGFHIKWMRKRGTDKWFVYTFIADKPVRELKRKIRALTHRQSQVDLGAVLTRINQIQRGWANYFRHAVAKHTFDRLHAFVWWRVITMVMHRHRMTWTALRRRFKGPHGWRPIAIDGIELFPISSVPVTRYRWRATTIPSAWPTETIEPAA